MTYIVDKVSSLTGMNWDVGFIDVKVHFFMFSDDWFSIGCDGNIDLDGFSCTREDVGYLLVCIDNMKMKKKAQKRHDLLSDCK